MIACMLAPAAVMISLGMVCFWDEDRAVDRDDDVDSGARGGEGAGGGATD